MKDIPGPSETNLPKIPDLGVGNSSIGSGGLQVPNPRRIFETYEVPTGIQPGNPTLERIDRVAPNNALQPRASALGDVPAPEPDRPPLEQQRIDTSAPPEPGVPTQGEEPPPSSTTAVVAMPIVDIPIPSTKNVTLPESRAREALDPLIEENVDHWGAGGIGPNSALAYKRYTGRPVIVFGTVGEDDLGNFYQRERQELGELQRSPDRPTGVAVYTLNPDGTPRDVRADQGAARQLQVPHEELRKESVGLVMLEAPFFRPSEDHVTNIEQIRQVTDLAQTSGGTISLNLSGVREGGTEREVLMDDLANLNIHPQFVVGNRREIDYLSGLDNPTPEQALDAVTNRVFPGSEVVGVTLEGDGARLSFRGRQYAIPAYPTEPVKPGGNYIGSGDTWLGVFLGGATSVPIEELTEEILLRSALTASFAAGKIGEIQGTSLPESAFGEVRDFYSAPYWPDGKPVRF